MPSRDPSPPIVLQRATHPLPIDLVAAAAVLLAATVAIGLFWPAPPFEVAFLLWIRDTFGNSLDGLMLVMDDVGDVGTVSIVLLTMVGLVALRWGLRPAAAVFITGLAALLLNIGIKLLVGRPRPGLWIEADSSYSLPSGHVLLFSVLVLLTYEWWPWDRWRGHMAAVGFLLVCLMGFSRLYLGEHYPTDVLAGLSIAILLWAGYRKVRSRSQTAAE